MLTLKKILEYIISFKEWREIKEQEEEYEEMLKLKEQERKINLEKEQISKFENALNFAQRVLEEYKNPNCIDKNDLRGENPLIDVVRLLGRPLQTELVADLVLCEYELNRVLKPSYIMFDTNERLTDDCKSFYDIVEKLDIEKEVDLSKDLVLPWPWSVERYVSTISRIGEGRDWGPWVEDRNHDVYMWLPLGISWVGRGNHSISSGIIHGNGVIKHTKVYDISLIYNYIKCDGLNYIRIQDNTIISEVKDLNFAIIFEIGRIMVENNISF